MTPLERKDVADRQLDALLERLDRLCDEVHALNRHLDSSEHLLRISREISTLNESLQANLFPLRDIVGNPGFCPGTGIGRIGPPLAGTRQRPREPPRVAAKTTSRLSAVHVKPKIRFLSKVSCFSVPPETGATKMSRSVWPR